MPCQVGLKDKNAPSFRKRDWQDIFLDKFNPADNHGQVIDLSLKTMA
jgi:hypothetical protein